MDILDFSGDLALKNLPANAGGEGLIPGSGRSPGEGNGNPLQYSCLENPMDRGAWWVTVSGLAKSGTRLNNTTKNGYIGFNKNIIEIHSFVTIYFLIGLLENFKSLM